MITGSRRVRGAPEGERARSRLSHAASREGAHQANGGTTRETGGNSEGSALRTSVERVFPRGWKRHPANAAERSRKVRRDQ